MSGDEFRPANEPATASLPEGARAAVENAGRWLRALMGEYGPRARVAWLPASPDASFPTGVRVTASLPEWGAEESHDFRWADLDDGHYVRGELAALWGRLLGHHHRAIIARLSRREGA